MRKERKYKFNSLGYAQLLLDLRHDKSNKISSVLSIIILGVLFSMGILSKEIFVITVCNTGIGKVSNWLVG